MTTPRTILKAEITSFSTSPTDHSNIHVTQAPFPPPPTKNEAQIRVIYAGFSGADVNMARGTYPLQRKAPLTPGYCLVGVVEALPKSDNANNTFKVGEYVVAVTVYDAQSEVVNLPVKSLVGTPDRLAGRLGVRRDGDDDARRKRDRLLQQICALALDWNTAHGMVERTGSVKEGDVVFIHGLSGAVGQALLVLCLLKGAFVYGTASKRNHEKLLGSHGNVKGVFDYREKGWVEEMKGELGTVGGGKGSGVDVVYDALGFESWDESYSILSYKRGGVLVGYGGNQSALTGDSSPRKPWWYILKLLGRGIWGSVSQLVTGQGRRTSFYWIKPGREECRRDLTELMELLGEGKIEVPMKGVWDLTTEGLREAHRSWGKMEGMGSLLIRVEGVERDGTLA